VRLGDLHAAARLHDRVVPVEVVHLQLHELHVRVSGEQLVEDLGAVVDGEPDVADLPSRLLLGDEIPHVELVELRGACATHVVEQVEVDVIDTQAVERRLEIALRDLPAGHGPGEALGGNGIRIPRVTRGERLPERCLRCTIMVNICGVEIGAPALEEDIDHLLELLDVDALLVGGVEQRQTHAAEAELGCGEKFVVHGDPLSPRFHPS